ncbi:pentapeptide repeat-containing protein [Chamaesiphon minutus]|uniref:Putative low-complexity protein n=1 Tax=Chamaesiphon minutus (strain ATCC 27169 / PCC 6605) TaxID=1173020 RepID=K9UBB1_CHAP6|nr:pentapeptide repeat-containing protein [Chamaesiphon minutus]AFY91908.1 putative low-complexity protein [Chamaesiphon minutus PCC 6605]
MEGADFLKLEELILLAIAGKSEIYGLEIATSIAKASEDKVQLNYGSLYPYLNRLEKKGYITSRWEEENERKGARRKYYQTTDKGTHSLDEAILIRQRLRQPNDVPVAIASQIQSERDVDKLLKILQHPEEKERIWAIYELQSAIEVNPELHWEIMQALATFIRTNSPEDKQGEIESDIQEALNVIGNRNIDRDIPLSLIDLAQTNLIRANLKRANLQGANLEGADLEGANLQGANLKKANLKRANLQGANLMIANLEGINLVRANLEGAILIRANLEGANLEGANLEGAILLLANFKGAYLSKANLQACHGHANFAGAYLSKANFEGADLEGANLEGANLQRANFYEVRNLTIEQLHSANNWQQTLNIPNDIDQIPF